MPVPKRRVNDVMRLERGDRQAEDRGGVAAAFGTSPR